MPGGMRRGGRSRGGNTNPQLFEDTSSQGFHQQQNYQPQGGYNEYDQSSGYGGGYNQPPPQGQPPGGYPGQQYPGQQLLQDPMANMAMQYGQGLADQGKDYVHKNLEKYVSKSKLKYYFAVDTSYVGKKLFLLLFPFAHKDWSIRYNQDEPVAPRDEINAPDLYIPVMAFVTYILLAGVVLGTQDRFTPEQLGMLSSTALIWLVIEILLLMFILYIMNVSTGLKYLDIIAYCGYKYIGMILALIGGLLFKSPGYYILLLWNSISLAFFLVRSLKTAIVPHADQDSFTRGNKRRLYTLLIIAGVQPAFMWWITRAVMFS